MDAFNWMWKSHDGLDMFAQGWAPEKPKAVICLVHGLGEHSGRYAHVAAAFGRDGYAMLGFDLRGHGRSGGQRGHAPSFEHFMKDIDGFIVEIRKRYPGLPMFIYGHSLGGILVLNYALRRKPDVKGVVATASGLRTALELQKDKVLLAKVLGTVVPSASLPSGLDPKTISRDPQVVEKYVNDPLVHYQVSLGMGKNLLAASAWAIAHADEFPVPLLIMHGTADKLGFKEGSMEFAGKVPQNCTLKLWDGLYHEIHNEPEQEEVFKFTLAWLDEHLK
jgi:alpha-beta hydrolase superfamily lysophospholipase